MLRALHVDPSNATPIWSQIEEGMRRLVASRALPAGAAVPSVRDLARDLSVNPATVAKAYQRLTDAGIFVVRRGNGTFVSERPPAPSRHERDRSLREAATRYASVAATLGLGADDARRELQEAWKRLSGEKGGGSK